MSTWRERSCQSHSNLLLPEHSQISTPESTVALHVARYSQRTEQQEGRHDLVKDAVRVKTTAKGKRVIEQLGEASFYGTGFHGRPTASGTRFNRHGLTAAHPTLPLGTRARVTNLRSGQSVRVRITDRGPYAKGRDLRSIRIQNIECNIK